MVSPQVQETRAPSLLYAVKQVELVVRARLEELMRPFGVTAVQYTALTVLERRDGLTSAELARRSFVTPQTISDLVLALERRGLVTRENGTQRRNRPLRLTPAGRAFLAQHEPAVLALEERMLQKLTEEERTAFRHALAASRAALA